MLLSDKLNELSSAFRWKIEKTENNKFVVFLWTKPKTGFEPPHEMKTGEHYNLHKAVEEAIEVLREHLSDCSLC